MPQLWLTTEKGVDSGTAANLTSDLALGVGIPLYFIIGITADVLESKFKVPRYGLSTALLQ